MLPGSGRHFENIGSAKSHQSKRLCRKSSKRIMTKHIMRDMRNPIEMKIDGLFPKGHMFRRKQVEENSPYQVER